MNLPAIYNYIEKPFLDHDGNKGDRLVNGKPYTAKDLENLFSGNTPYEAAARYGDELKETVRRCLAYRLEDRPTLEELKAITGKNVEQFRKARTTRSGKARSDPEDLVVIKIKDDFQQYDIGQNFNPPAPEVKKKGDGKGKGGKGKAKEKRRLPAGDWRGRLKRKRNEH